MRKGAILQSYITDKFMEKCGHFAQKTRHFDKSGICALKSNNITYIILIFLLEERGE
jgi:hypothetical protein